MPSIVQRAGAIIGHFEVISPTEAREHNGVVWNMRCTRCGAEQMLSARQAQTATCTECIARDGYAMGILWALCSALSGKYVVRSADPHFPEYIAVITGCPVRQSHSRTGPQYVTTVPPSMMKAVLDHGWSGRWDAHRVFPRGVDAWAFARAYLQAHCSIDAPERKHRKRGLYRALRLRIYGPEEIVRRIGGEITRMGLAKPKTVSIGSSHCTLYYQSAQEVGDIVSAIEIELHSSRFVAQYEQAYLLVTRSKDKIQQGGQ